MLIYPEKKRLNNNLHAKTQTITTSMIMTNTSQQVSKYTTIQQVCSGLKGVCSMVLDWTQCCHTVMSQRLMTRNLALLCSKCM